MEPQRPPFLSSLGVTLSRNLFLLSLVLASNANVANFLCNYRKIRLDPAFGLNFRSYFWVAPQLSLRWYLLAEPSIFLKRDSESNIKLEILP